MYRPNSLNAGHSGKRTLKSNNMEKKNTSTTGQKQPAKPAKMPEWGTKEYLDEARKELAKLLKEPFKVWDWDNFPDWDKPTTQTK